MLESELSDDGRLAGYISATGSAGTIAAGDYLKEVHPGCKIGAAEALQCPTLLNNGFGGHRIEGIGDKHVPWIHNVRNTDMVIAVDDNHCMNAIRLFNEEAGREYLRSAGVGEDFVESSPLFGISGMGNLVASIKFAKYYELTERDVVFTILTDSIELYESRIEELHDEFGPYTREVAMKDHHLHLLGLTADSTLELTYPERRRVHNLKYFTWDRATGT